MNLKDRQPIENIIKDRALIDSLEYFKDVFNSISTVTLVLNSTRQLIFASNNFLEMLQLKSDSDILGFRPGEAFACIHAKESSYGCNNSNSCSVCGALLAVLESERTNTKVTKECRITSTLNDTQISWELSVTSIPLNISDNRFYIVSIVDVSSEKRKKQLEKIFIHDLVNSAGGISGLMEVLEYSNNELSKKKTLDVIAKTSKLLLGQILSYRDILSAESGELDVKKSKIETNNLILEAINLVSNNKTLKSNIIIDPLSENIFINSDEILLSRVLVNMLKNAVEAENDIDSIVVIGSNKKHDKVKFWVKNNSIIPKNTQKQIFQRSFSTKGSNRGLGTYSMKLLGERYLKGEVGFKSNQTDRTIFYIEIPLN